MPCGCAYSSITSEAEAGDSQSLWPDWARRREKKTKKKRNTLVVANIPFLVLFWPFFLREGLMLSQACVLTVLTPPPESGITGSHHHAQQALALLLKSLSLAVCFPPRLSWFFYSFMYFALFWGFNSKTVLEENSSFGILDFRISASLRMLS